MKDVNNDGDKNVFNNLMTDSSKLVNDHVSNVF